MSTWNSSQSVSFATTAGISDIADGDLELVNGGVLPAIGFAIALASHVGVGGAATTVTGHILSGVGLGMATFGLANYLGGGGGRKRGSNSLTNPK